MFSLIEAARRDRQRPGFSIIDLLIVVVALAVLAAILLPKLMDSSTKGKEAALRDDLRMLRNAIDAFHVDTGHYPAALADLAETDVTQVEISSGATVAKADWHGPYVEAVPNDPISGGSYSYEDATGKVLSSTSGRALNGTEYSRW